MKNLLYAIGCVITFLLLYYAAAALISAAFIAYYLTHGYSRSGGMLFNALSHDQSYNIVILAFLLLTIFYILFYKIKKRKVSELIQAEPTSIASIVLSIIAGFSFYLVLRFCVSFFLGDVQSFHIDISRIFYGDGSLKDRIVYVAAALIILPILEEIAHRGILFGILQRKLSIGWALLVQAIVYALIYSEPYIILYTLVLGIIAGAVYQCYRSILLPILIHLSFNAAALIMNVKNISKLYDANDYVIFIAGSIILALVLLLLYRFSIKPKVTPHLSVVKKVQA